VGEWAGTASSLLEALNSSHCSTQTMRASDTWPKSANALSARIKRMTVNLRKEGILIDQHRRTFTIKRTLTA
jgi:hypothetical protein